MFKPKFFVPPTFLSSSIKTSSSASAAPAGTRIAILDEVLRLFESEDLEDLSYRIDDLADSPGLWEVEDMFGGRFWAASISTTFGKELRDRCQDGFDSLLHALSIVEQVPLARLTFSLDKNQSQKSKFLLVALEQQQVPGILQALFNLLVSWTALVALQIMAEDSVCQKEALKFPWIPPALVDIWVRGTTNWSAQYAPDVETCHTWIEKCLQEAKARKKVIDSWFKQAEESERGYFEPLK